MKSVWKKIWPLVIAAVIACSMLIFYGAAFARGNGLDITEENLAENASISGSSGSGAAFDGSRMTAWHITSAGAEAVIELPERSEVNAFLLNESGFNMQQFSVYAETDGEWELVYRQCEIGVNRLATFYPVRAKRFKVVIDKFKNIARISDIKMYRLEEREREDFNVTAYVRPEHLLGGLIDPQAFETVTHVQFLTYGNFTAEGGIEAAEDAPAALDMLKELIGGRDVKISVCILSPKQGATMAQVLDEHREKAAQSVADLVRELGVAGADFDWEYPSGSKEWRIYSDFLTCVGEKLHAQGSILSVALSPWGVDLTQEAVDSIDQLQLMSYDMFDYKGDNNSYSGASETPAEYFISRGFKPEQLNLGISFYGRPDDGSGVWIDYNSGEYTRNEYIMYENGVWFNTVTTVRDKTVFAALKGLGGVMIFSLNEDLPVSDPLSLTAEIGRAKQAFVKEAKQ